MIVLFLHGLQSSPNSYKRKMLEDAGHTVYAPVLPSDDWKESVIRAREAVERYAPDVIVASSRGGAVAMATHASIPMVLIAPAWSKYAPWETISGRTTIIHSVDDEIVNFSDSKDLARIFGAKLVAAGQSHRMNDEEASTAILEAINASL